MSTSTDYAVPTGEYIAEWLEESGISQAELARRMGVTPKHVSKLLAGAPLTPDVATKLELVTGIAARIWLSQEATYRADVARLSLTEELVAAKGLAASFPLSHLRKIGRISGTLKKPGALLMELLAFFQVGSVDALRQVIARQAVAYRQGTAHAVDEYALATWLKLGEMEAAASTEDLPPFDHAVLEDLLPDIRRLSVRPTKTFGAELVALLAKSGVQLIYVPEVQGARMYGATRWINGRPVIALTARGRNDGQFWFTLFHEIGHVLLHQDQRTHIRPADADVDADPAEREANVFASLKLIPRSQEQQLRSLKSKQQVRAFADSIGVSPGVVVGRLWHDKLWDYRAGHDLCLRLVIVDDE